MIVLEVLPFVLLSVLAVGLAVGSRRLVGPERMRRIVRWLRPLPFVAAAAAVYFSH